MNAKRLSLISMLTAVSLAVYFLEAQIPPPVAIPGVKLGLSNIITLISLVLLGARDAAIILGLRILLASIFAGQAMSFIYSVSGGFLCFSAMFVTCRILNENQLWAVSIVGALAHNAGQLIAAALVLSTPQIFWYAPALAVSGIVTGLFTGLCAQLLIQRLRKSGLLRRLLE